MLSHVFLSTFFQDEKTVKDLGEFAILITESNYTLYNNGQTNIVLKIKYRNNMLTARRTFELH